MSLLSFSFLYEAFFSMKVFEKEDVSFPISWMTGVRLRWSVARNVWTDFITRLTGGVDIGEDTGVLGSD